MGIPDLALGVGRDVAGEPPAGQVLGGRPVDDVVGAEPLQARRLEAEVRERIEEPAEAGDHAEAASLGQAAGEQLEGRRRPDPAVGEQGGIHRQLVTVGQERGARAHARDHNRLFASGCDKRCARPA